MKTTNPIYLTEEFFTRRRVANIAIILNILFSILNIFRIKNLSKKEIISIFRNRISSLKKDKLFKTFAKNGIARLEKEIELLENSNEEDIRKYKRKQIIRNIIHSIIVSLITKCNVEVGVSFDGLTMAASNCYGTSL